VLGSAVGLTVEPASDGVDEGSTVSPTLLGFTDGTLVGLAALGISETGASVASGDIVGLI
jgi:hypothetical protein